MLSHFLVILNSISFQGLRQLSQVAATTLCTLIAKNFANYRLQGPQISIQKKYVILLFLVSLELFHRDVWM